MATAEPKMITNYDDYIYIYMNYFDILRMINNYNDYICVYIYIYIYTYTYELFRNTKND